MHIFTSRVVDVWSHDRFLLGKSKQALFKRSVRPPVSAGGFSVSEAALGLTLQYPDSVSV